MRVGEKFLLALRLQAREILRAIRVNQRANLIAAKLGNLGDNLRVPARAIERRAPLAADKRRAAHLALARDSLPQEDLANRAQQNLAIEPEAHALDILDIESQFVLPANRVAPAHLRKPRDSGQDIMPPAFTARVEREIRGQQRARTHEAHLAAQDIVELG